MTATRLLLAIALILLPTPNYAQECLTVDAAEAIMRAGGRIPLGVRKMPFSGPALFYVVPGGRVFSLIITGECVSPIGHLAGPLVPETKV